MLPFFHAVKYTDLYLSSSSDICREQNYSGDPKKSPKGDPGGPFLRDKGDPFERNGDP